MPAPTPEMMEDFKQNLEKMQQDMQATYAGLSDTTLKGYSDDQMLGIEMTATYQLKNWEFDERALKGGMQAFKQRLTEAWNNLNQEIQGATQNKTRELLEKMPIPDEMKNMSGGMPKFPGAIEHDASDRGA